MICKFASAILFDCICCSFILTMWYVNTSSKTKYRLQNNSFILTMWYVNILKQLIEQVKSLVLY